MLNICIPRQIYSYCICNTLRGRIKGSYRVKNLIMPSHQGNPDLRDPNSRSMVGFNLNVREGCLEALQHFVGYEIIPATNNWLMNL